MSKFQLVHLCFFCCCSQEEQEVVSSIQPQIESDETKTEPLTVIEQPEVPPQPTANQAMKGTCILHVFFILTETVHYKADICTFIMIDERVLFIFSFQFACYELFDESLCFYCIKSGFRIDLSFLLC